MPQNNDFYQLNTQRNYPFKNTKRLNIVDFQLEVPEGTKKVFISETTDREIYVNIIDADDQNITFALSTQINDKTPYVNLYQIIDIAIGRILPNPIGIIYFNDTLMRAQTFEQDDTEILECCYVTRPANQVRRGYVLTQEGQYLPLKENIIFGSGNNFEIIAGTYNAVTFRELGTYLRKLELEETGEQTNAQSITIQARNIIRIVGLEFTTVITDPTIQCVTPFDASLIGPIGFPGEPGIPGLPGSGNDQDQVIVNCDPCNNVGGPFDSLCDPFGFSDVPDEPIPPIEDVDQVEIEPGEEDEEDIPAIAGCPFNFALLDLLPNPSTGSDLDSIDYYWGIFESDLAYDAEGPLNTTWACIVPKRETGGFPTPPADPAIVIPSGNEVVVRFSNIPTLSGNKSIYMVHNFRSDTIRTGGLGFNVPNTQYGGDMFGFCVDGVTCKPVLIYDTISIIMDGDWTHGAFGSPDTRTSAKVQAENKECYIIDDDGNEVEIDVQAIADGYNSNTGQFIEVTIYDITEGRKVPAKPLYISDQREEDARVDRTSPFSGVDFTSTPLYRKGTPLAHLGLGALSGYRSEVDANFGRTVRDLSTPFTWSWSENVGGLRRSFWVPDSLTNGPYAPGIQFPAANFRIYRNERIGSDTIGYLNALTLLKTVPLEVVTVDPFVEDPPIYESDFSMYGMEFDSRNTAYDPADFGVMDILTVFMLVSEEIAPGVVIVRMHQFASTGHDVFPANRPNVVPTDSHEFKVRTIYHPITRDTTELEPDDRYYRILGIMRTEGIPNSVSEFRLRLYDTYDPITIDERKIEILQDDYVNDSFFTSGYPDSPGTSNTCLGFRMPSADDGMPWEDIYEYVENDDPAIIFDQNQRFNWFDVEIDTGGRTFITQGYTDDIADFIGPLSSVTNFNYNSDNRNWNNVRISLELSGSLSFGGTLAPEEMDMEMRYTVDGRMFYYFTADRVDTTSGRDIRIAVVYSNGFGSNPGNNPTPALDGRTDGNWIVLINDDPGFSPVTSTPNDLEWYLGGSDYYDPGGTYTKYVHGGTVEFYTPQSQYFPNYIPDPNPGQTVTITVLAGFEMSNWDKDDFYIEGNGATSGAYFHADKYSLVGNYYEPSTMTSEFDPTQGAILLGTFEMELDLEPGSESTGGICSKSFTLSNVVLTGVPPATPGNVALQIDDFKEVIGTYERTRNISINSQFEIDVFFEVFGKPWFYSPVAISAGSGGANDIQTFYVPGFNVPNNYQFQIPLGDTTYSNSNYRVRSRYRWPDMPHFNHYDQPVWGTLHPIQPQFTVPEYWGDHFIARQSGNIIKATFPKLMPEEDWIAITLDAGFHPYINPYVAPERGGPGVTIRFFTSYNPTTQTYSGFVGSVDNDHISYNTGYGTSIAVFGPNGQNPSGLNPFTGFNGYVVIVEPARTYTATRQSGPSFSEERFTAANVGGNSTNPINFPGPDVTMTLGLIGGDEVTLNNLPNTGSYKKIWMSPGSAPTSVQIPRLNNNLTTLINDDTITETITLTATKRPRTSIPDYPGGSQPPVPVFAVAPWISDAGTATGGVGTLPPGFGTLPQPAPNDGFTINGEINPNATEIYVFLPDNGVDPSGPLPYPGAPNARYYNEADFVSSVSGTFDTEIKTTNSTSKWYIWDDTLPVPAWRPMLWTEPVPAGNYEIADNYTGVVPIAYRTTPNQVSLDFLALTDL